MGQQIGCIWLPMGIPMVAHGDPYGCPWTPYGCSEAAFGSPWGRIWLLRGSIWLPMGSTWLLRGCFGSPWDHIWLLRGSMWLPMGLHMAAQRLHLAAEGLHFAAQGPSMAPMRQICSICCIWLGQAGVQDGREHGQGVVNCDSQAPNPSSRMGDQGSTIKDQG